VRVKLTLLSFVLACAFAPALGQTKPAEGHAPEKADRRKPVSEEDDVVRISVTLVQVDAVVTDKHVRKLRPGDDLNYAFVAYNAKVDKASASPRLTMQLRMFREGKEVHAGPVSPLQLKPQPDWQRINVAGSLRLAANAQPGEYMIMVLVTDPLAKEKYGSATQWADFEIIK